MIVSCGKCKSIYDDAEQWASCPHADFINCPILDGLSGVTMKDYVEKITANGWGGFSIWHNGGKWMGCLLKGVYNYEPDYSTNLWDWQDSYEDVIKGLAKKAEETPYKSERTK